VNEVTAHAVQKVRVLVDDVLIVKEEFVWLEQLLLLNHELVHLFVILHDLVIFHIVV